jgi:hypothetical protein
MGLSIGYKLTFAGSFDEARSLMQALHSTALDLPLKHVTELRQLSGDACSPEHHPPMDPIRDRLAGPGERIYYVTGERRPDELLFEQQSHIVQPEHVIGFSTSPILEYPDYEHWEALGESLAALQPLLERVRTRRPEENPDISRGETKVSKPPSGSDKTVRRGQPPRRKRGLISRNSHIKRRPVPRLLLWHPSPLTPPRQRQPSPAP